MRRFWLSIQQRSLRGWVLLSTVGGVLLSGWFFFIFWMAEFPPRVLFHVELRRQYLLGGVFLLWVAGLAIGGWLAFWPQVKIRDGMRQAVWAETEIAPIRRRVNRIFGITAVAFLFVGFCMWVRWLHSGHSFLPIYFPCFIAMQWSLHLSKSIGPPPRAPKLYNSRFADMKPIQSQHWGE